MVARAFADDDRQRVAAEPARIEVEKSRAGAHERYRVRAEKVATATE